MKQSSYLARYRFVPEMFEKRTSELMNHRKSSHVKYGSHMGGRSGPNARIDRIVPSVFAVAVQALCCPFHIAV